MDAQDRPALRDFQTWMQTFIVSEGSPEQALTAAECAAGFASGSAERLVKPSPTLVELERLMIYRRMYPLRMEEALGIDFPVSRLLLGREAFSRLVADYVQAHPSTSWTLDHLGRHMVPFVRDHALASEYPGLHDLVRLEQAMCEVYNELDSPVLAPADIATVEPESWPGVRLEPIPAFRLLALQSNSNDLFRAYNQERALPPHRPGPTQVVVWRQGFQTWRMPLEKSAYAILERLARGCSLGDALADALEEEEADEARVFDWFNTWVREGFFRTLRLPSSGVCTGPLPS